MATVIKMHTEIILEEELFGCMRGRIQENGDITKPIDVCWDVEKTH